MTSVFKSDQNIHTSLESEIGRLNSMHGILFQNHLLKRYLKHTGRNDIPSLILHRNIKCNSLKKVLFKYSLNIKLFLFFVAYEIYAL